MSSWRLRIGEGLRGKHGFAFGPILLPTWAFLADEFIELQVIIRPHPGILLELGETAILAIINVMMVL